MVTKSKKVVPWRRKEDTWWRDPDLERELFELTEDIADRLFSVLP